MHETEKQMSFDKAVGAKAPAPLPLQFVNIEITPIVGGRFAVAMQATLLDETDFEFVGEDLAHAHVSTIEEALTVIRDNVAILSMAAPR
jgi:hypothetical protein